MKVLKKIAMAVSLMVMVMAIGVGVSTTTKAAIKIQSGTKMSMAVGDSDKIYVKQKGAKFTSGNKKIVTVNSKGKVKAKKVGSCKIKVKVGSESKNVKVTVKPAKVTIKSVALSGETGAKVTWKKVTGAKGYYVYYSTKKSSGYKKVKVTGAKTTTTTIKNLSAGTTYYFKVKAYAKAGKKTVTSGSYSKVMSVKTWKMVWNDEFNGTSLDSSKWNCDGATGGGGYGNQELQDYEPEYSEVTGGNLVIKPQFTWNPNTKAAVANSYYSTKLWTKGQYTVKYGRIDFRVKLPKGKGTWAAAWMLGVNNDWPLCGEIDVLETTSDITKTSIPQSIHNNRFNGMATSSGNKYKTTTVSDATSAFHTYGIIWDAETVTFTIDGSETWTYDPDMYVLGDGNSDQDIWPFNQNFYLILNCAIGGTLGGDVDPTYWTKIGTDSNGNEIYQDYYYIDYVRVYE